MDEYNFEPTGAAGLGLGFTDDEASELTLRMVKIKRIICLLAMRRYYNIGFSLFK